MSAVLLAVFRKLSDAEKVRTDLVRDGFPTDRVELTARAEKGRAGLQPATSTHEQFQQYFSTLLKQEDERAFVSELAGRVAGGDIVTITVHPRGDIETARATEILESEGAQQLVTHDLQNQSFEHAASTQSTSWLAHLLPDNTTAAGRFYLRLLPAEPRAPEHGRQ